MKFKHTLLISFLLFSISSFASNTKDSVGVENLNGQKIILHKVESKQNYYSIGRIYAVSPKKIMDLNNNIPLTIGVVIKIPSNLTFEEKPVVNKGKSTPVFQDNGDAKSIKKRESVHVVQSKETLYAIASKYNMRVDDLKLLNNLTSNSLSVGQTLKVLVNDEVSLKPEVVKNEAGKPEVVVNKPYENPNKIKYEKDSIDSINHIEIPRNRYGITEKNEKGVAVTISDENLDNSKSYALHSIAPVGTIVKITNPMTNRSVFAKVVGKYTENATTKDVIIVINKAVADALGALDKRFLVNITYGLPNEQ